MGCMIEAARRDIFYGQLSFFAFILISIFLEPQSLTVNHGLSFFGINKSTLLPYGLGLVSSGWFTYRAAAALAHGNNVARRLGNGLLSLLIPMVGILLTPYSVSPLIGDLHELFGAILFLLQLGLAIWLVVATRREPIPILLVGLQILGGIIAWVSLNDTWLLEIQGQLLFQAAFGVLLVRVLADF